METLNIANFDDFPLPPPMPEDASKSRDQLLSEMEAAIQHDRNVLQGWGLSQTIIQKQEDWRRGKYQKLLSRRD